MIYYIKTDSSTNKVTSYAESAQDGFIATYVDKYHEDFFKANFSQVAYSSDYKALVYPDNYQLANQLGADDSSAYKAIMSAVNTASSAANSATNDVAQSVSALSSAIIASNSALAADIAETKNIAQVKDGKNYLTAAQQQDVINYVMTNTPLDLAHVLDNAPARDIPISLAVVVKSPQWQYMIPQLSDKQNVTVSGNTIILTGKDCTELQQTINTEFYPNQHTIWAVLHYGDNVTVTSVGLFYGEIQTGPTINDLITDINELKGQLVIYQYAMANNGKAPVVGTNYLDVNTVQEIKTDLTNGTAFNINDIYKNIPSLGGKIALTINATSPEWAGVTNQLITNTGVTVNGNTVSLSADNPVDLLQILNDQFDQSSSKNVWAVLRYGTQVTINDIGLYYQ